MYDTVYDFLRNALNNNFNYVILIFLGIITYSLDNDIVIHQYV